VIDPQTRQQYRLVRAEVSNRNGSHLPVPVIPAGVRVAREALWRDLPELLKSRGNHGQCVCYHGNQRIGLGEEAELIRACQKLGLHRHEYYIGVIELQEFIEEEETEAFRPDLVEGSEFSCPSS